MPARRSVAMIAIAGAGRAAAVLGDWLVDPEPADLPGGWFPFANGPGFSYNRGPGGGFYAFKA